MSINGIVPKPKSAQFLDDPSRFTHDDLSETEILVLTIVQTHTRLTISELVLLVRDNPIVSRTFLDVKHIAAAVHSLDTLGYLEYQLVEY